jgi:FkbM family methyltransferase
MPTIARLAMQGHELVWCAANKLMWWRRLHKPQVKPPARIFGDRVRYQWPIVSSSLNEASVIYSFGIGTNATFELSVIAESGCQIFAFDPTPRSAEWARQQVFPPQFHFLEYGIAEEDGEMEFYPPRKSADITYSAYMDRHDGGMPVRAPVRTVGSLMDMLGHRSIDMLKMDVEGCEYRVIDQLVHHGFYGFNAYQTRAAVSTLQAIGYQVFWVSDRGLEYGFVHRDALRQEKAN